MDLSLFLCLRYTPQKGYNHINFVIVTQKFVFVIESSNFKSQVQMWHLSNEVFKVIKVLISSLDSDPGSSSD